MRSAPFPPSAIFLLFELYHDFPVLTRSRELQIGIGIVQNAGPGGDETSTRNRGVFAGARGGLLLLQGKVVNEHMGLALVPRLDHGLTGVVAVKGGVGVVVVVFGQVLLAPLVQPHERHLGILYLDVLLRLAQIRFLDFEHVDVRFAHLKIKWSFSIVFREPKGFLQYYFDNIAYSLGKRNIFSFFFACDMAMAKDSNKYSWGHNTWHLQAPPPVRD